VAARVALLDRDAGRRVDEARSNTHIIDPAAGTQRDAKKLAGAIGGKWQGRPILGNSSDLPFLVTPLRQRDPAAAWRGEGHDDVTQICAR
jgi:hypothetical protein